MPKTSTMVGTQPNHPITSQIRRQAATVTPNNPRVVRYQPISAVQSNAGSMKVTLEQAYVLFRQQSLCRKIVLLKL
jgi:hypothetical protein